MRTELSQVEHVCVCGWWGELDMKEIMSVGFIMAVVDDTSNQFTSKINMSMKYFQGCVMYGTVVCIPRVFSRVFTVPDRYVDSVRPSYLDPIALCVQ